MLQNISRHYIRVNTLPRLCQLMQEITMTLQRFIIYFLKVFTFHLISTVASLWSNCKPSSNFVNGHMSRVVSSKISYGKFIQIFLKISRNLLKNFFHFILFNYNHIKNKNKHVLGKQFSRSLCFNFMHYVQQKVTCI